MYIYMSINYHIPALRGNPLPLSVVGGDPLYILGESTAPIYVGGRENPPPVLGEGGINTYIWSGRNPPGVWVLGDPGPICTPGWGTPTMQF